ncbi:MAG TPA: YbhB/YbcL family Raf kinase inhibitor-like protein [Acidimicrobiia bacterium]|nr:YbhB/YbcL family Raf kinase inhibitor-like protein [Acidimicrobiia bacterium]
MRRPLIVLVLVVAACSSSNSRSVRGETSKGATMASSAPQSIQVTSSAFRDGETIPAEFTCGGAGHSPPLRWTGVPSAAVEVALVVDDPDAPGGTFLHWVLFALPPGDGGVEAATVPSGARQGRNGFGKAAYGGPCPPKGDPAHHYRFTVYALSRKLDRPDGAPGEDVRRDAEASAMATGRLVALYGRS